MIKNRIDKIRTDIWDGGITNPLTVIVQLTYLMFIRSLDEKELENEEFANMTGETADLIFPQSEVYDAKNARILGHSGKSIAENAYTQLDIQELIEAINKIKKEMSASISFFAHFLQRFSNSQDNRKTPQNGSAGRFSAYMR